MLDLQGGLSEEGPDQVKLLPQPTDRKVELLVQLLQASFTVGNENERRGRLPRYWLEAVAFGGRKSSLILAAALSGSNASGGFAFV